MGDTGTAPALQGDPQRLGVSPPWTALTPCRDQPHKSGSSCRAKGPQPLSCPPIQEESPSVLGVPASRTISAIKPHVLLVVRRRAVAPWGHPMGQEEECVPAALSGYRCPGRGSADARVHSGVLLMDGSVRGVGRAGGAEAHP